MDYLNAAPLLGKKSTHEDMVVRDGFIFRTSKRILDKKVVKSIDVEDDGVTHYFEERVQLFTLAEMEVMVDKAGMDLVQVYGSYHMDEYIDDESDRLILLARKP